MRSRWLAVRRRLAILSAGSRAVLALAAIVGAISTGCGNSATNVSNDVPTRSTAVPAADAAAPAAAQRQATPAFDAARAWAHLTKQVAFGPRPSGSPALHDCRQYIVEELRKVGIEPRQQMFVPQTPIGEIAMVNIIATIPGRRAERIILASHYDTKRAPFRFVGANDSASSTAALLELARVLKTRQNEFTIELLFLDGEESVNWEWQDPDNTYGSRHYVETVRKANGLASIKALVLLDMIGEKENLTIRRDATSTPWLVDIIWTAAERLGHRSTFSNELTAITDDHVPFLDAGVPAVDLIDLEYPQWHTAEDDVNHVSEKSLKIVGDVVLAALPDIESRLSR